MFIGENKTYPIFTLFISNLQLSSNLNMLYMLYYYHRTADFHGFILHKMRVTHGKMCEILKIALFIILSVRTPFLKKLYFQKYELIKVCSAIESLS